MANLHDFENVDRENIEEWLEHDSCNGGFQIMSDADIIISNLIQPEEQENEAESGEEEISP